MHASQVSASLNCSIRTLLKLFPSNLALKSTEIKVLEEIAYLLIDLKGPWYCLIPFDALSQSLYHTPVEVHIPHCTVLRKSDQSLLVQNCGQIASRRGFPCQPSFNQSSILLFYSSINLIVGRDTAVGIGTRYGLDGPEIESRRGRDFRILSVGPYSGCDRKPKHVAVFSNKYVVSTAKPSIWSSKSQETRFFRHSELWPGNLSRIS